MKPTSFNILLILQLLIFIMCSNCFHFSSDDDDIIIKFNIENKKKNDKEYIKNVQNRIRNEMKFLKKSLFTKTRIPEDLEIDTGDIGSIKVYEMQNSTENNISVFNKIPADDFSLTEFADQDVIKSIFYLLNFNN